MGLCFSSGCLPEHKLQRSSHHAEVLFFPDTATPCKNFLHGKCKFGQECKYSHSPTPFGQLLKHLMSTKRSLDIALFTITHNMIRDVLLELHRKRVRIRIISDDQQAKGKGSDIYELARAGIKVVHDNCGYHMHHKFAIVDGKKIINGSLNWSVQGVRYNQENVMVSSDPAFVRPFQAQFDAMWTKFRNNVVT